MLKDFILFLLLPFVWNAYAQKVDFSFELVELNRLYTGYPLLVKVQHSGNLKGNYTLVGKNLTIQEKGKGFFIVTPGESSNGTIYVVQQKKKVMDTLYSKTFRINDLPPTTLYLGSAVSGSSITEPSNRLMGKYTPDIPLNATHLVLSWKLIYGDDVIVGQGTMLSAEAENYIKTLQRGSYLVFECVVLMQDRTKKTVYGIWRKEYED